MDLGSGRLKELRERRGLSLRALAALSGVSPDAINLIERGKRKAQLKTARKLAAALDVEPSDLSGGPQQLSLTSEDERRRFELEALRNGKHAIKLLRAWRQFIDGTALRWEALPEGPTPEAVGDILDTLERLVNAEVFQPGLSDSAEFAEIEAFELEMLHKGIQRLRIAAEPVLAAKEAERARRRFEVIEAELRQAS
jgi:transcriptional regulator with XRE-family HTH domain